MDSSLYLIPYTACVSFTGSDSWTPEERRLFNKGITAYKKDFLMVQKLVRTGLNKNLTTSINPPYKSNYVAWRENVRVWPYNTLAIA